MDFNHTLDFANDRGDTAAGEMIVFANQALTPIDENGLQRVLLAPYGDHPYVRTNPQTGKPERVAQRLQKADAEAMVNEFNSLLRFPHKVLGLPWYIGHPDHEKFRDKPGHQDQTVYGRIKAMEAAPEGLCANVKWNDDGLALIKGEKFEGHSVNWTVQGESPNSTVFHPVRLKSVGFTNDPNIITGPIRFTRAEAMANARAALREEMANVDPKRSAAAKKAWETRRANGWKPKTKKGAAAQAMAKDRKAGGKPVGVRERNKQAKAKRSAAAKAQYEKRVAATDKAHQRDLARERDQQAKAKRSATAKAQMDARVADTDKAHEERRGRLEALAARADAFAKKYYGQGERGGRNHDRAERARKELTGMG